jgi:hypothetical protein
MYTAEQKQHLAGLGATDEQIEKAAADGITFSQITECLMLILTFAGCTPLGSSGCIAALVTGAGQVFNF